MKSSRLLSLVLLAGGLAASAGACNDSPIHAIDTTEPPDGSSTFDPGKGGNGGGGYYGNGTGTSSGGPSKPECPAELEKCPVRFEYPYNGETSVELRGDYRGPDSWQQGAPMTNDGNVWSVTVPVVPGQAVLYKYCIDGCATSDEWVPDPNPAVARVDDGSGGKNSKRTDTTCTETVCDEPDVPPPAFSTGATPSSISSSSTASTTATPPTIATSRA